MALIVPGPHANYPPEWGTFDEFAPRLGTAVFAFTRPVGDLNRFAARYKAARCFRSADFDGLSQPSVQSYSGLMQLLLTYSAFEYFLKCISTDLRGAANLLSNVQLTLFLNNLRRLQGQSGVFAAVRPHVNGICQEQIDLHLQDNACNPWYLAASIRHGFAHGALTATPNGVEPQAMGTVSRFLSRALFQFMDSEFRERMHEFERMIYGD